MTLVKLELTGEKAGYGMWVNTAHILEVCETRERDYVKMIGSGDCGPYSIGVESAAAAARAVHAAEVQSRGGL